MTNLLPGPHYLAAFDPGESTGWATFNAEGGSTGLGTVTTREGLYELLAEVGPVAIVVIEDFRLFQHKALQQSGSKMEAVRVIGAIESWAYQNKSKIILQAANIKPIAVMWSGMKPKGKHANSHHVDAYNHGYYYLRKSGIIKPKRVV